MRTVVLDWVRTNMSRMDSMNNTYLYMLSYHGKIRYIGMTSPKSAQSVQDEIRSKNRIEKFDGIIDQVVVWLGVINRKARYKDLILHYTNKIVHEIEGLLIYKSNPDKNVYCKNQYNGRELRIINNGCDLLKHEIKSN